MKSKILGLLAVGMLAGPMVAEAGLIGSNVNLSFYYPNTGTLYCNSGNAAVGGGVEYPAGCSGFSPVSVDIADNQLIVGHSGSSFAPASFNGFLLTVLSGPAITSASYAGGTLGFTSLLVDNGNLWVNFAGQGSGSATFDLGTNVPEPGTLALLGLGLVGLGMSRRRKLN
jgi:PEP-CTERM motif